MEKRILFINGHLNAGGVERALVDILAFLRGLFGGLPAHRTSRLF